MPRRDYGDPEALLAEAQEHLEAAIVAFTHVGLARPRQLELIDHYTLPSLRALLRKGHTGSIPHLRERLGPSEGDE
jgi:hypothetical protein